MEIGPDSTKGMLQPELGFYLEKKYNRYNRRMLEKKIDLSYTARTPIHFPSYRRWGFFCFSVFHVFQFFICYLK